jgi:hypothetical protein
MYELWVRVKIIEDFETSNQENAPPPPLTFPSHKRNWEGNDV